MGEPRVPRKRFKVTLTIEAWEWPAVIAEIDQLSMHLDRHGPICNSVCGGGSTSHTVRVDDDPEMTETQYAADLEAYVTHLRGSDHGE